MATFVEPTSRNPRFYQEDLLVSANRLNNDIKRFIENTYGTYDMPSEDLYMLEEFEERIENFLREIPSYNSPPRTDNLTKEGILIDLRGNLPRIAQLIDETNQRIVRSYQQQAGNIKRKTRKIGSRRMKRKFRKIKTRRKVRRIRRRR
jgi:hypothetical protein